MVKTKTKKPTPGGQKNPVKRTQKVKTTHYALSNEPALTHCANDYAELLTNPYVRSHSSCIPTIPARKSRKYTAYVSGTFQTQTSNGLAAIGYNPWSMCVRNAAVPSVFMTTANSVEPGIPDGGIYVAAVEGNSDYVGVLGGFPGVQFRLVAAGIRVMYDGSLLNVGGRIVGVEDPDHQSIAGRSFSELTEYDESRVMRIEPDAWYQLEYHPVDDSSMRYGNYRAGSANVSGTDYLTEDYDGSELQYFCAFYPTAFPMGFALLPAETDAKFIFEAYAHFEAIGRLVRGATPSHVDLVGLSAVSNTTGALTLRQPKIVIGTDEARLNRQVAHASARDSTKTAATIIDGLLGLASKAVPAIISGATHLLGGPIVGAASDSILGFAENAVKTSGGQRLLLEAAHAM